MTILEPVIISAQKEIIQFLNRPPEPRYLGLGSAATGLERARGRVKDNVPVLYGLRERPRRIRFCLMNLLRPSHHCDRKHCLPFPGADHDSVWVDSAGHPRAYVVQPYGHWADTYEDRAMDACFGNGLVMGVQAPDHPASMAWYFPGKVFFITVRPENPIVFPVKSERKDPARMADACEICGSKESLAWDHDHATGLYRGTLCRSCNTGLGMFGDDANRLQNAIDYLTEDEMMTTHPLEETDICRIGVHSAHVGRANCDECKPETIEAVRLWIRENCEPAQKCNVNDHYSYLWKHYAELSGERVIDGKLFKMKGACAYVSNGEFIVAAIREGYLAFVERHDGVNALIKIRFKEGAPCIGDEVVL